MVSDDEYLERIVAGIQTVTTDGADVTWNETLNGRQFDVVVRFTMGTLKYLVLIEVKNRSRKASASDIEAFATKADDHNANKAVFVTAAGFQSGAKDVAYRHGIDLFTVKIDQENVQLAPNASYVTLIKPGINVREPPRAWLSEPHLVALTYKVEIVYENGQVALMPGEQSQATYYGARTKLTDGRSITQILNMNGPQSISVGETKRIEVPIKPSQHLTPPDEHFFPAGRVKSLVFHMQGKMGRAVSGNTDIEPGSFAPTVIYTDEATGKSMQFHISTLPLGNAKAETGKFYFLPHPLLYYYCDKVESADVRWILIESFQAGQLFQAVLHQHIDDSPKYIPVSDKAIISRLKVRLDLFRNRK